MTKLMGNLFNYSHSERNNNKNSLVINRVLGQKQNIMELTLVYRRIRYIFFDFLTN